MHFCDTKTNGLNRSNTYLATWEILSSCRT